MKKNSYAQNTNKILQHYFLSSVESALALTNSGRKQKIVNFLNDSPKMMVFRVPSQIHGAFRSVEP